MPLLLLSIFLTFTTAFADVDQISATRLNLDYVFPHGTGDIEKLNINLSLVDQTFPVEVERVEDTYVLRTPMLDFNWIKPWPIAKTIDRLMLANFSGSLGGKEHVLSADTIVYRPKNDGDYKLTNVKSKCVGTSQELMIGNRMMADCLQSMVVTVDKVEVPVNMFWIDLQKSLPKIDTPEEMPVKDFYLGSEKGNFYLYFLARYVVTAGLRTWGSFHYEDNFKTIVIKVDQIKFGVIPVTNLVMNELKKQIKNPSVKVEPPYIRIAL
jgi:hypothetical protein